MVDDVVLVPHRLTGPQLQHQVAVLLLQRIGRRGKVGLLIHEHVELAGARNFGRHLNGRGFRAGRPLIFFIKEDLPEQGFVELEAVVEAVRDVKAEFHVAVQPLDGFLRRPDLKRTGFPRRLDRCVVDAFHLPFGQPHTFAAGVLAVNVEQCVAAANADGVDSGIGHLGTWPVCVLHLG